MKNKKLKTKIMKERLEQLEQEKDILRNQARGSYFDSVNVIREKRKSFATSNSFQYNKLQKERDVLDNKIDKLERKIQRKKLQRKYR